MKNAKKVDPESEEAKAIFEEFAKSIINDTPKQPTNEELFGHLTITEEQVKKAEQEWDNKFQSGYKEAVKPIDPNHEDREWGMRKSFVDNLSPEELKKYNKDKQ